jgi:hypothetical protein
MGHRIDSSLPANSVIRLIMPTPCCSSGLKHRALIIPIWKMLASTIPVCHSLVGLSGVHQAVITTGTPMQASGSLDICVVLPQTDVCKHFVLLRQVFSLLVNRQRVSIAMTRSIVRSLSNEEHEKRNYDT